MTYGTEARFLAQHAHEGAGEKLQARFGQCDTTCTVDCGHCKGKGKPPALTDRERTILNIAKGEFYVRGARENAIYAAGLTLTGYAQVLNRLIDTQAAEAAEPVLVHRLRRIRATNQARKGR
jgi:hypothetical protein